MLIAERDLHAPREYPLPFGPVEVRPGETATIKSAPAKHEFAPMRLVIPRQLQLSFAIAVVSDRSWSMPVVPDVDETMEWTGADVRNLVGLRACQKGSSMTIVATNTSDTSQHLWGSVIGLDVVR